MILSVIIALLLMFSPVVIYFLILLVSETLRQHLHRIHLTKPKTYFFNQ